MNLPLSIGGHLLLKGDKMKPVLWIAVGGLAVYLFYKYAMNDQAGSSSVFDGTDAGMGPSTSSFAPPTVTAAPAPAGPQQSVGVDPVTAPLPVVATVVPRPQPIVQKAIVPQTRVTFGTASSAPTGGGFLAARGSHAPTTHFFHE